MNEILDLVNTSGWRTFSSLVDVAFLVWLIMKISKFEKFMDEKEK